ncbi:hypothetical protein R3O83_11130 [Bacteroides hominis (ex Liu et al. 2022)]|uniref:hypothetical protein n=1 Tax=Bacteroides hominis TaxID=2763023 RepID=UPI002949395B|nr:hypothetical protein [Bacteroides hominis (ex Liu et al. 2022)]MDV6143113.1 hypothetical protein [Bacteroides hominis (ex Liu et al. 2022)]
MNFAKPENDKKRYWAGTEVSENEAWTAMCSGYFASSSITDKILVLSPQDKKKKAFVRCVRDFK